MSRLIRNRRGDELLLSSKAIHVGIAGRIGIVLMIVNHRRSVFLHIAHLHTVILVFIWSLHLLWWVLIHGHCHRIHLLRHHRVR